MSPFTNLLKRWMIIPVVAALLTVGAGAKSAEPVPPVETGANAYSHIYGTNLQYAHAIQLRDYLRQHGRRATVAVNPRGGYDVWVD